MPCFTWINTVLGNVKTTLAGTCHAFNFRKYAHRYLAACQHRFNRRFDLKAILTRLVRAAEQLAVDNLQQITEWITYHPNKLTGFGF
jgi:hypothetical protein